jgi:hypothetical protein
MNNLLEVVDLDFDEVISSSYDLAYFASGYETRCTLIPSRLTEARVRDVCVFGFRDRVLEQNRAAADAYFTSTWRCAPLVVEDSEQFIVREVGQQLAQRCQGRPRTLRVLVDYTSMSRLWYSSIVSVARFAASGCRVEIDFVYAAGEYSDNYADELADSTIETIVAIPGMEGLSGSREQSVAVLGLGFTPLAGLGVLERVQPTTVISFLAAPASKPEYENVARTRNAKLLEESDLVLDLPFSSVAMTYKRLCETLVPFLEERQIAMIPMGPKPHVLSSLLVACRFREVASLYARMSRSLASDIPASGMIVACRAVFQPSGTPNEVRNQDLH